MPSAADSWRVGAVLARWVLAVVFLAGGVVIWPEQRAQAQQKAGPGKHKAAKQERADEGRSEIILTNLPPKNTKAYKDLLGLAGKTANGQILSYSGAEMWAMPDSRVERVIRAGQSLGVKTTRLGADWNHILKAPQAPMPMSGTQASMLKDMRGAKETMGVGVMAAPDPAVLEYALMKDQEATIGSRPAALISQIVVPLSDHETITARRTRVELKKDGCTWRGEIAESGEPIILMWWKNGRFSGMFTYRGHMYSLKSMGGQVHAVVETDPGRMPPDHGAMGAAASAGDVKDDPLVKGGEGAVMRNPKPADLQDRKDANGGAPTPAQSETANAPAPAIQPLSAAKRRLMAAKKVTIDVMMLYTPRVAQRYIDIDSDLLHLAIEQANESFANSGLANLKLNLVHKQQIDYDDTEGEHFNHLYRMVDGVGAFAGVRQLRNEKRADVVALIVDDPSGCGLSTRVGADAEEAYVVVHHSCAALTYSIAHEIGHIIGARHDKALDANTAPLPYGHGYVNGTKWRDIMSYKASCDGCPRVPIWSNPTMTFRGDPAGTLDADNARVLLERAERVSKFR
jgi:hypothetical protein